MLGITVNFVITGRHSYVSARWYTDPSLASTWNYMSVHARGVIRFLDEAALEAVLQKTSLHLEDGDHDSPTVFENISSEFKEKVMSAIVAFEIEVQEQLLLPTTSLSSLNILLDGEASGSALYLWNLKTLCLTMKQ